MPTNHDITPNRFVILSNGDEGRLSAGSLNSNVTFACDGYDDWSFQVRGDKAVIPASCVLSVQLSLDGYKFSAPATAVTLSALGMTEPVFLGGARFARLTVSTPAAAVGDDDILRVTGAGSRRN